MIDYRIRKTMTNEQVWIVRDLHAKGLLNIAKKAREYGVSPPTIRSRLRVTSVYPEFPTQEYAKIRDQLQASYCVDTAD